MAQRTDAILDLQPFELLHLVPRERAQGLLEEVIITDFDDLVRRVPGLERRVFLHQFTHFFGSNPPDDVDLESDLEVVLGQDRIPAVEILGVGVGSHRNIRDIEQPAPPRAGRSGLQTDELRSSENRPARQVSNVTRRSIRIATETKPEESCGSQECDDEEQQNGQKPPAGETSGRWQRGKGTDHGTFHP